MDSQRVGHTELLNIHTPQTQHYTLYKSLGTEQILINVLAGGSHLLIETKYVSWLYMHYAHEKKKREINSVLELAHLKVLLDEIHNKNTSIYT